jgi:myb proto-oncogene protein
LDPDINSGRWTLEEDSKLTEAVKKYGSNCNSNWVAVAAMVPRRRDVHCRSRWVNHLSSTLYHVWKPEEDAKLTEAVEELGTKWARVAAMVPSRTDVQCRYRWVESLYPNIALGKKGKWTVEEDAKLTEAVEELGTKWVEVAAMVPSRTDVQCRYRWVESLDPNITLGKKGKWTVEEDAKLTEAVEELGTNWARVAAMVPSRTNTQCRYRWVESLDPKHYSVIYL